MESLVLTPSHPGRVRTAHTDENVRGRTLKGSDRRLDRETDYEDPKEAPDVLECVESAEANASGDDAGHHR
jgi:hypothetical protein